MKALTISQPWASLIANGDKFVENRTWETFHRGSLAIHAGKGQQYIKHKEAAAQNLPIGAVIAVACLEACVHLGAMRVCLANDKAYGGLSLDEMRRVYEHHYTEGPFCWVFSVVKKLAEPVEWKGAQGLWNLPDQAIEDVAVSITTH